MLSNPPQSAQFGPADHGLISWSYDPSLAGTGLIVTTAGRLYMAKLKVPAPSLVTSLLMMMSVAGATLTAGQNFAMLFDEAGSRVGVTADMSTLWTGATGNLDMPLIAPVQVNGPFVYVGWYANGSTLPTFRLNNFATAANGNINIATAVSRYGAGQTGLTTTPPATLGTINGQGFPYWVGLR